MTKEKKWILPDIDCDNALRISEELGISFLAAKILCARGFNYTQANDFLNTDDGFFYDPYLLNDMDKAVKRIHTALDNNEKIAVYGDYDVDGITATYIMFDYLKKLGADVIYYIPDRISEGYGMNTCAIDMLRSKGVNLIITVDVGITAFNEAEYCTSSNMDLIITDHHSLKETLPEALAVINPKIPSADYPFDALAGVGVAFKLIYALSGCDKKIFDKYCDIVAIGTIADMVPLKNENRYIATEGIKKLRETSNKGIKAIMQVAGLNIKETGSSDISFGIAPRLNAAGRMSDAVRSVELLIEEDSNEALNKAELLDSFNKKRQQEEQIIFDEAIKIISDNGYANDSFILVAKEGWANGIIGIVSSKLTERFYKPTAVVSINPDGTGKASGRSIKGINLFELLSSCSDSLIKYGGHELAAGFTVKAGLIEEFRAAVNSRTEELITDDIATPSLNIDCCISLDDISLNNAYSLSCLEPYGIDNSVPMLCIYDLKITGIRHTQNKKHVFITVTDGETNRELPAFSMAEDIKRFRVGDYISVAGTLGVNTFKGKNHPQFIVRDIHESKLNKYVSRSELAIIFSDIRSRITKGITLFNKRVTINYTHRKKLEITNAKIQTALKIFCELMILNVTETDEGYQIHEGVNFKSKTDLNNSSTFVKYNFDNIQ